MQSSDLNPKLIFGLGNNDSKYKNTYHNVGFLMIDYLEKNYAGPAKLMKNPGYVNEAGKYLKKAGKGVKSENILVVQDDSDIVVGEYKFSFERGSAGHKGIENIIQTLKTKNFWRLRIGIRPPAVRQAHRKKAGEFVLKKITAEHQKLLNEVFEKAIDEIKNQINKPR